MKFALLLLEIVKDVSYGCTVVVSYREISQISAKVSPSLEKNIGLALIYCWLCSAKKLRLPFITPCVLYKSQFC